MPNQNQSRSIYNFDKIINRESTANVKYDLRNKIFATTDVIPMWVADMDFETPNFITEAVIKRAQHPIFGYSFRTESYYNSIRNWLQVRHNWEIDTNWIVFSPGVVPALNFSTLAYTNIGDSIIVQPPVYFPFFSAVTDNKRIQLNNKLILDDNRYVIDFEGFEINAKQASMFFLSSPHNPVGRVWTREELTKLGEICVRNNVIIISDEIHSDIILPGYKHIPIATISKEIADITITCIAPSKTFNIAGLATSSVIISNKNLREKFEEIINRYHLSGGNLFGAIASEAGYTFGADWVDALNIYIQNNFDEVDRLLLAANSKIKLIKAESTYLGWLDFNETGLKDKQIRDMLIDKAKLGLSPGAIFGPGGKGFQRINLATPLSVVSLAIERLTATFNN
jgi:cystathionine beta-lyase